MPLCHTYFINKSKVFMQKSLCWLLIITSIENFYKMVEMFNNSNNLVCSRVLWQWARYNFLQCEWRTKGGREGVGSREGGKEEGNFMFNELSSWFLNRKISVSSKRQTSVPGLHEDRKNHISHSEFNSDSLKRKDTFKLTTPGKGNSIITLSIWKQVIYLGIF